MIGQQNEYERDSSDEEDVINTVGNVPSYFYEGEDHIGYDISGRRILKPSSYKKGEIDKFIDNFDNKDKNRIVKDPNTGQDVLLSEGDIMLIRTLCNNRGFLESIDNDLVSDWFTREKMETPISANPPQKASFIPSLNDKKKVSLIVHAIKTGRMKMPTPVDKDEFLDADYDDMVNLEVPDIYSPDYGKYKLSHVPEELLEWLPKQLLPHYKTKHQIKRHVIHPPMEAPPGHDQSYRPPPEYLLNDQEKKQFITNFFDKSMNPCKHIDEKPMFPKQFDNLRSVGYSPQLIIDIEQRAKDCLFASRVVKDKVASSTAEMLLSSRPPEETMRPYPNTVDTNLINMEEPVLSVSVSQCGQYIATASRQSVKVWSTTSLAMRRHYPLTISESARGPSVSWNPCTLMLAIASGRIVRLANPLEDDEIDQRVREWWRVSRSQNPDTEHTEVEEPETKKARSITKWNLEEQAANRSNRMAAEGCRLSIELSETVLEAGWHSGGDYLHTVSGTGTTVTSGGSLHLHRLSKCQSQSPFGTGKKQQCITARFHGVRSVPRIYVAEAGGSKVSVYDLAERKLLKSLQVTGQTSCMEVHHGGDHLVVGTEEGKVCWFDLDMGVTPFKTLNLSGGSIRSMSFHGKYPLLSCATDNGSLVVFYARVYSSYEKNASIHAVENFQKLDKAGDMRAIAFHPEDPRLYCAGADKSMRIIHSIH